ncbi:MAG: hypothetical protein WBM58_19460 [Sedimenticolaceae bacterium]
MIRISIYCCLVACLFAPAQAAMVITSESGGYLSKQYFEKGEFVLMRDDKPSMGIDAQGNCWFLDGGQRIFDTCEEMLQSMNAMKEQVMAGLSAEDRAMMERAMEIQSAASPVSLTIIGNRKIAGYIADCYAVGAQREVCISTSLLDEIKQEMGSGRFAEMLKRFGESAAEMGAENPESKALKELSEKGFPMLDMQQVTAPPGLNSSMLKFLPEAQRNEIMEQLDSSGVTTQMKGNQVSRVQKNVTMPNLDFSRYRRIGFREFLERKMAPRGGGKWEGFPPEGQ